MSSPREVDRRLNQHGSDIEALYEISTRIETKVDRLAEQTVGPLNRLAERTDARFGQVDARLIALDTKVDRLAEHTDARLNALDTKVDRLAERTDARFEQVDARFEQVDARFGGIEGTLAQHGVLLERILQRLDRD